MASFQYAFDDQSILLAGMLPHHSGLKQAKKT